MKTNEGPAVEPIDDVLSALHECEVLDTLSPERPAGHVRVVTIVAATDTTRGGEAHIVQHHFRTMHSMLALAAFTLVTAACGSNGAIGFRFSGHPTPGVASRVAWTVHLASQSGASVVGADDGVVVVASTSDLFGYDASTGKRRYDVTGIPNDAGGVANEVVAVTGGRVLIATVDADSAARLAAFDVVTGQQLWSVPTVINDPKPIVDDGSVYVADRAANGSPATVHAYALSDGVQRWSTDLPKDLTAPADPPLPWLPTYAFDGGLLTVVTGDGSSLSVIDAGTGTMSSITRDRPLLAVRANGAANRVAITVQGAPADLDQVEVLDAMSGAVAWSTPAYSLGAVTDQLVIVRDLGAPIWTAFDVVDGTKRWDATDADSTAFLLSVVTDSVAITDALSVIDLATGTQLSAAHQPVAYDRPPYFIAGVEITRSVAHAYDVNTGEQIWQDEDGYVAAQVPTSNAIITELFDSIQLRDVRTGTTLWTIHVGKGTQTAYTSDVAGNLYVTLTKYQGNVATIVAITTPAGA